MFDLDSFLDETFADNSDIDDAAGLAAEDFMNGRRNSLPAYLVDQANKTARTAPRRTRSNAR